jgi:HK97 family phage prohead protease
MPEVTRAREVLSLMRAGALDGLSIGFRTVQGRTDPATGVRRLDKIDLWEISLVTFPMLPEARVSTVKRRAEPALSPLATRRLAGKFRHGARLLRS